MERVGLTKAQGSAGGRLEGMENSPGSARLLVVGRQCGESPPLRHSRRHLCRELTKNRRKNARKEGKEKTLTHRATPRTTVIPRSPLYLLPYLSLFHNLHIIPTPLVGSFHVLSLFLFRSLKRGWLLINRVLLSFRSIVVFPWLRQMC